MSVCTKPLHTTTQHVKAAPVVRQQGVALISVLLVFALAAIIGSEVMSRNYRDIQKTAHYIDSKQAYYYALAGEQLARQILYRDFQQESEPPVDSNRDIWAQELASFHIDNGTMTISIVDLQSRFNLNNLLLDDGTIDPAAAMQYQQLLDVLSIDSNTYALTLDWLDLDDSPLAGGGEDGAYQSAQYLSANQAMADVSELRLLKDLDLQDYLTLKEYVVALAPAPIPDEDDESQQGDGDKAAPPKQATTYNINTLDVKLLEALFSLSSTQRDEIITGQNGGYDSLANAINEVGSLAPFRQQLAVNSEYFEINVAVNYDGRLSKLRTQVFRSQSDGKMTVLQRQQHSD